MNEPLPIGLAVALGAGLLVGIERERRKGSGDDREAAGLRSFAVAGGTGGLAQWLPTPGLVLAGAVLVAALAALSYARSRSRDPGLTTELALFATYLIGVQSVLSPALGAACAAGLAALLASRARLHRFATVLLSEQELHDALLLAAFALIALPLIPAAPIASLGGIAPRPLAALVLLILAIQAAGQLALRWLGPRGGLLATGFVSGFVSSTATVASFGARARAEPARAALHASAASLSAVATWAQAVVLSAALAPPAALSLLPVALAGATGAAAVGALSLRAAGAAPADAVSAVPGTALRLREALAVAAALALVSVGVGWAERRFGDAGLVVSVGLAALADAHAPVASLASLQAAGSLSQGRFVFGTLLAIGVNSLVRIVVATVAGGAAYALRVGAALLTSLALAGAAALLLRSA